MSLVVSDSGPVHYILLCGVIEVVPKLFSRLIIPPAVARELTHENTPAAVSQWIRDLPEWASVQSPRFVEASTQLGLGEREAIALALELRASHLLVDDRAARRLASQRGILISGTIGILELASARGLLDLPQTMQKLLATNFRIDPEVVRDVLSNDAARRKHPRPDE